MRLSISSFRERKQFQREGFRSLGPSRSLAQFVNMTETRMASLSGGDRVWDLQLLLIDPTCTTPDRRGLVGSPTVGTLDEPMPQVPCCR